MRLFCRKYTFSLPWACKNVQNCYKPIHNAENLYNFVFGNPCLCFYITFWYTNIRCFSTIPSPPFLLLFVPVPICKKWDSLGRNLGGISHCMRTLLVYKHRVTAYLRGNRSKRRDALDDIDWRNTYHGCFCLKARAEVESADHLYSVEDGVRLDNRISTGDHFRASPGPQRLLNESSSLLIAEADENSVWITPAKTLLFSAGMDR